MPKAPKKKITVESFTDWLDGLKEIDRENFYTLLNLPKNVEVIAKMPEGKYREMAIFGLAVKEFMNAKNS